MAQNFTKPHIIQADIADMQLLLTGCINADTDGSLSAWFQQSAQDMIPVDVAPFTSDRVLELYDKSILTQNAEGINIDGYTPAQLQTITASFQKMGMEDALDDGIITQEEFLLAGAARGNLELQEHPDRYANMTQEQYEAAQELLEKYDIEDPDGTIARGIAINVERLALKANQGLDFNANGTRTAELSFDAPAAASSTPTSSLAL